MSRKSGVSYTARIDAAVLEAARDKRRAAILISTFFGFLLANNIIFLAVAAVRGDAAQTVPALYAIGLFLVPFLLILSIARRRPPRRAFWAWLLAGGALIALGPVIALVAEGSQVSVSIPGRWEPVSESPLSTTAPMLWVLAGGMMLVGILGVTRRTTPPITDTGAS